MTGSSWVVATSHYLMCWPRSISLYDVTRSQWVTMLTQFSDYYIQGRNKPERIKTQNFADIWQQSPEFIRGNICIFYIIPQHWGGTGSVNLYSSKTGLVYPTLSITLLLIFHRHKEPSHQQQWYKHVSHGYSSISTTRDIFLFCFYSNMYTRTLLVTRGYAPYTWTGQENDNDSIGSDNGLAPNRRQSITWTNTDPVHWRIYGALGGDELSKRLKPISPQNSSDGLFYSTNNKTTYLKIRK